MKKMDFIDLGLPSGNKWATEDFTTGYIKWQRDIDKVAEWSKEYYISYEKLEQQIRMADSRAQIPSYSDFHEIVSCCNVEYFVDYKNGRVFKVSFIGPNGNRVVFNCSHFGNGNNWYASNGELEFVVIAKNWDLEKYKKTAVSVRANRIDNPDDFYHVRLFKKKEQKREVTAIWEDSELFEEYLRNYIEAGLL